MFSQLANQDIFEKLNAKLMSEEKDNPSYQGGKSLNKVKLDQKNMNNNSDKINLPWWVELFFVQIGLPDRWLRPLLNKKRQAKILLSNNKKIIYYTLLLLLTLIYFQPILKKATNANKCISSAKLILSQNELFNEDNHKLNILSNHICNGGDLLSLESKINKSE